MNQEFRPHPVLVNYEASRGGVVRHCKYKRPIGQVDHHGYLRFTVRKKKYFVHRTTYECFNGSIKDGLVIDHINGIKTDNSLENLQATSQRENTKKCLTGTCKTVGKRPVKSFDTDTNEEKLFHSMTAAGKHFDICMPSVGFVAEGIYQTAISKKTGHRIKFSYYPLMDDSD